MNVSRRQFGKVLLAGSSALAMPSLAFGAAPKVVVVGGGGGPVETPGDDTWGGNDNNFGDDDNTWGGGTVEYFYVANDCDGLLPNVIVQSNTSYALGVVVNISGSGYAGTCWTLTDYHTGPQNGGTILDVFATCVECQSL